VYTESSGCVWYQNEREKNVCKVICGFYSRVAKCDDVTALNVVSCNPNAVIGLHVLGVKLHIGFHRLITSRLLHEH
jgi:hypothetical protein